MKPTFSAILIMLGTIFLSIESSHQALAGDDSQLMLEMLNAVGQGLNNSARMKDCVGGNATNWSRCNMESQQRMNQYMEGVNHRVDEMTDRNLEEIAVDICKDEEDERDFERCVRKQMRDMKRR